MALKGRETCIARSGGDEFAVLLPEVSQDAVAELVIALKTQLAAQNGSAGALSFSVGAATAETDAVSLEKVEHEADAAMYRDKLSKPGRVERRKAQV